MGTRPPKTVRVSMDILDATISEGQFIHFVERNHPELYEKQYLRRAIRRYETIWLPIKARFPKSHLIPPIDVHWIWHAHMMDHSQYREDTLRIIGTVPDHQYYTREHWREILRATKRIWENHAPEEPFNHKEFCQHEDEFDYTQRCLSDLYTAVNEQRQFYANLRLPNVASRTYFRSAIYNYLHFLHSIQSDSSKPAFLSKTEPLDVHLVWHAHLCRPLIYSADTQPSKRIFIGHRRPLN